MITNERQYRITKVQLAKLKEAAKVFDLDETAKRIGSKVLAKAELEGLKSEVDVLSAQLKEYQDLKAGLITTLEAKNLQELPSILIRARIAKGLAQGQLAEKLGIKEQQIQRYESEEYASASLRRLTEVADALELNISEVAELGQIASDDPPADQQRIDWGCFPVKEMYRRSWFENFSGSMVAAMAEAESLAEAFITKVVRRPLVSLHRKRVRSGSVLDPYALLAWECRILILAEKSVGKSTYVQGSISDEWLRNLAKESRFPDGPLRARNYLQEAGIALVIEPHLPHTHLDGAAFLHGERPVIGLTLRYDRLDNFWFVLFHELIHVSKHLRKGRVEFIFDDMEAAADEIEQEADELAGQALIPEQVWETALARYIRTKDSVKLLAEELEISPTIIAGRIQNEANNYVILNELVGQGEVRKHFPDVRFGR